MKPYKYYWRYNHPSRVSLVLTVNLGSSKLYLNLKCCSSISHIFRPDVKFFCDLDYDPFLLMEDTKKVYGQLPVFSVLPHR